MTLTDTRKKLRSLEQDRPGALNSNLTDLSLDEMGGTGALNWSVRRQDKFHLQPTTTRIRDGTAIRETSNEGRQ